MVAARIESLSVFLLGMMSILALLEVLCSMTPPMLLWACLRFPAHKASVTVVIMSVMVVLTRALVMFNRELIMVAAMVVTVLLLTRGRPNSPVPVVALAAAALVPLVVAPPARAPALAISYLNTSVGPLIL